MHGSRVAKPVVPADFRQRLETARLDGLVLFRALDKLDLSAAEIPQRMLRDLFELDADFAEALWALDQPPKSLDLRAMIRDTQTSLAKRAPLRTRFIAALPLRAHAPLADHQQRLHTSLTPADAYTDVPGRDPKTPHFR